MTIMAMARYLRSVLLAALSSVRLPAAETGFAHTQGKFMVAPNGEKLLLRGINLGNWLVPEGYMFTSRRGRLQFRPHTVSLSACG